MEEKNKKHGICRKLCASIYYSHQWECPSNVPEIQVGVPLLQPQNCMLWAPMTFKIHGSPFLSVSPNGAEATRNGVGIRGN